MSSTDQRFPVFPTRMALSALKTKLRAAQNGHNLLKRKSDALSRRFRITLAQIRQAKLNMGSLFQNASFSLTEAYYSAGDISVPVREHVRGAYIHVQSTTENVFGVQIPVFKYFTEGSNAFELVGLGRGGKQIQKAKNMYIQVIQQLVELASLQTSFHALDRIIKSTNRRVNALEYMLIPKLERTISYVVSELDEQDREEFFRLKKVQGKSKVDYSDNVDVDFEIAIPQSDPDIIF